MFRAFRRALFGIFATGWFLLYVYRYLAMSFAVGEWQSPTFLLSYVIYVGWYFVFWVLGVPPAVYAVVTGLYCVTQVADEPKGHEPHKLSWYRSTDLYGFKPLGEAIWMSDLVLLFPLLYLVPPVVIVHDEVILGVMAAYSILVGALVSVPLWIVHLRMEDAKRSTLKHLENRVREYWERGVDGVALTNRPNEWELYLIVDSVNTWPMNVRRLGEFVLSFMLPALAAILFHQHGPAVIAGAVRTDRASHGASPWPMETMFAR